MVSREVSRIPAKHSAKVPISRQRRATWDPAALIAAMRVPETLASGRAGLWEIVRQDFAELTTSEGLLREAGRRLHPYSSLTALCRTTMATLHRPRGEIVMEDSPHELRRHFPILRVAHGRVLVTGLGLGCVVRGLLALPDVEHVDVVELCPHILNMVGPAFASDPRVTLHAGDALTLDVPGTSAGWDFAWHDIWTEGPDHLDVLHLQLFVRYLPHVRVAQGAWNMNRRTERRIRAKGVPFL